jgi:hypothetical protein
MIVEPDRIPAGGLDRDRGVTQARPIGALDPEGGAEPQSIDQPSSPERKRNTGVAVAYAVARISGRSGE